MVCVYKLKAEKVKKNRRVRGTIFFFARGKFFILNQSFGLSMSKFLHLLFSLEISCFKKLGKIV